MIRRVRGVEVDDPLPARLSRGRLRFVFERFVGESYERALLGKREGDAEGGEEDEENCCEH